MLIRCWDLLGVRLKKFAIRRRDVHYICCWFVANWLLGIPVACSQTLALHFPHPENVRQQSWKLISRQNNNFIKCPPPPYNVDVCITIVHVVINIVFGGRGGYFDH